MKPDDVWVLDPTPMTTLTLISCWPFDYIGHAPERFIVRAERIPTSTSRAHDVAVSIEPDVIERDFLFVGLPRHVRRGDPDRLDPRDAAAESRAAGAGELIELHVTVAPDSMRGICIWYGASTPGGTSSIWPSANADPERFAMVR